MFQKEELEYYRRQLILEELGAEKQMLLKNSSVLVVGAGGLGCPVLQYLVIAGIGQVTIIDNDIVHYSNLHRQILYTADNVGKPKAKTASEKLEMLNPHVKVKSFTERLSIQNVDRLIIEHDVVVDCTDNFGTRYLINDFCIKYNKPFVYGALHKYEGFVSVFNAKDELGDTGPCYRDLHPTPPQLHSIKNCEQVGVLGVIAGLIGTIQATETIKIITQIGKTLSGKLLVFDALEMKTTLLPISKNIKNQEPNSMHYNMDECGSENGKEYSVDPKELSEKINNNDELVLVNVNDNAAGNLLNDSLHIPLNDLEKKANTIPRNKHVIIFCERGIKSTIAVDLLRNKFNLANVYHLEGGLKNYEAYFNSLK